ncbi:MAG TPA: YlmC/YmxH family sporulation protein [Oscillospiraceae bacterium]|nr:YlmC/YmxH family sporulation protein [Oscillospiraceae bacterium]
MLCSFSDLRCKEVINIKTGSKIGFVDDMEIDTCDARIKSLIVFGRAKLFGLLGREEDIIIRWCDIQIIGEDTILICCDQPCKRSRKHGWFYENFVK